MEHTQKRGRFLHRGRHGRMSLKQAELLPEPALKMMIRKFEEEGEEEHNQRPRSPSAWIKTRVNMLTRER